LARRRDGETERKGRLKRRERRVAIGNKENEENEENEEREEREEREENEEFR
jgi:hypothetical protein